MTSPPAGQPPRPPAPAGAVVAEAAGEVVPARLWTRDFGLFFTARGIAKLGDMMLPVALAAGLVQHGGGAGAVGLAMASFTGCFAGFVVFGGVIADRFEARALMIGADVVRIGTEALAAVLFFTGHVVLWQVCVIGAVNGVCAAMFQPGVASTVPRLAHDVQAANGAIRTAESCMAVLGPAAAGVLVGWTSAGCVFAAHAGTYLLSALCLLLLRLPERPVRPAAGTFRADLAEGWREFRARTWMWGAIVVWMILMGAAWGPSVPLVATEVITAHGDGTYGLVNSALGAGMAVGGLLAMRIRPRHPLRAGAVALFGFFLQPVTVGAGLGVAAIVAGFVVAGAAMAFWSVMWATSIQTQVPGTVLNRIHAYEVAGSVVMMPVGQALAGPAAGLFGASQVLLAAGAVSLAASAALLAVPAVRNLTRVDQRPLARHA
ncbi:MFS transporter [Streptomyces sp. MP131-18]|uniref:MFS transporter n=1 Tax=Streptomyces sp. MP131-18 TaxID=1857892 RepID=UPI00097BC1B9|nr:MFS transporter [Streptomyces sp. MP131-18]ONK13708.1 putative bacilysin exporter BacE [Streptomyces sp. MP131-18]